MGYVKELMMIHQCSVPRGALSVAEERDSASHAAKIEAKDRRIVALLAELAKRKELPPLPDSVRDYVENIREREGWDHLLPEESGILAVIDALYPKPVPQWELDARTLERGIPRGCVYNPDSIKEIAARIREAGRGDSK